ncbi:hypothetical protein WJX84_000739 [Apatococcus fuscideae]|uniref:AB hydrolase-1 domain-containing protein n=1 Tax=Apatococcus fuscideae TaxID=2026836 RepID=A0AAW1RRF2_9CHLO
MPTVARVTHLAQVSALPDQSIIGSSSQYRQQQTCANVRRSVGQHRVSACPGQVEAVFERDAHNHLRLQYRDAGWNFWEWQHHTIHYIQAGPIDKPPIVLVHGFGASAYHWRYNIPDLARKYRVYAVDLLGFGWSEKACVSYEGYAIWQEQLSDFIALKAGGQPVVLVGNSLGGYNSLATAARYPRLVRGVVLVNAAGRFEDSDGVDNLESPIEAALTDSEKAVLEASLDLASHPCQAALSAAEPVWQAEVAPAHAAPNRILPQLQHHRPGPYKPFGLDSCSELEDSPGLMRRMAHRIRTTAVRAAVFASFLAAKQPSRIRRVLQKVYTDRTKVDDELVHSIALAAEDASAAAVFYLIITANGIPFNQLLAQLKIHCIPMMLLWGEDDPWIRPVNADRIQKLYPLAERFSVPAGHCPHDDLPETVNKGLLDWLDRLQ